MYIGNLALPAVAIDRVVNVAFGHFGQGADAELKCVTAAGSEINQLLIHMRLVDEARLLPHGGHRRIVRMRGKPHPRLLGHGNNIFQESLQPAPEFFTRNRWKSTGSRIAVVNPIPDRSIRNWNVVRRAVHPHGDGMPTAHSSGDTSYYARQTEDVPEHRNASLAQMANDGLDCLDLLRPLRAIEQNVVPVRGIEVLNRSQSQPGIFNFTAHRREFLGRPNLIWITRKSPGFILRTGGLVVTWVRRALIEIIDQVNHDVRTARLAREVVVIARQHMTIEA